MKVLIADDDPMTRTSMRLLLESWGYEAVVVEDGDEAWAKLSEDGAPLMAILDWGMPGLDGLDVCRKLRCEHAAPYVYVLMLTARANVDDVIEAMAAEADDFLVKPFHPQELEVRLRAGRRIIELQESLLYQAYHDPLTDAWNRAAAVTICSNELARAKRDGSSVGIMLADLDHFKRINDDYGHKTGDDVLCEAVRRLQHALRVYDSVCRYGGEEFLIVLPGCDESEAMEAAKRINQTFSTAPFETTSGSIAVTASIGLVVSSDGSNCNRDDLIHIADQALYQAKSDGRNCVRSVLPLREAAPVLPKR